jgi:hypothetical protein
MLPGPHTICDAISARGAHLSGAGYTSGYGYASEVRSPIIKKPVLRATPQMDILGPKSEVGYAKNYSGI